MASRGRQTFNKRLKEQQRKEKQQEKFTKRLNRPEKEGGIEIASADDEIASEIKEIKEEASRLGSDVDLTGLRLRINGHGGTE